MAAGEAQADNAYAISCHASGGTAERHTDTAPDETDGALIALDDCSCCQVILAGGLLPYAAGVSPLPVLAAISLVHTDTNIVVGGPRLAAYSRGPPRRA